MTKQRHHPLIATLTKLADKSAIADIARFFHADPDAESTDNRVMGVAFGDVFAAAKACAAETPLVDLEQLLENSYYEVRMGAVSIMDFQARAKRTTEEQRKGLFELYLRRHDRINNWDLVDRAAPYVVGGYLHDKPRDALYKLARSKNPWERRTAIVSTYYFIRQDDVDDTFGVAEALINDQHEYVQKAVASWVREAGKRDEKRLRKFLDSHAAHMPRAMLRSAAEKLPPTVRAKYVK